MIVKALSIFAIFFLSFFSFNFVFAADLYLSPSNLSVNVGDNFKLTVYVDSSKQSINAISFRVSYPTNFLKVNSISKTGSIINFWVQEPIFSNGEVYTEGVVMNPGFTGNRGKILEINFTALKEGSIEIKFLSGSVLANDGYGTNILENLRGINLNITKKVQIEEPKKVTEEIEAIETKTIGKPPSQVKIFSTTHSDQDKWYQLDVGTLNFDFSSDVKSLILTIYHNDNKISEKIIEPHMKKYDFEGLNSGKWEFILTAKNDYGSSKSEIYKIQIDKELPQVNIYEVSRSDLSLEPQFTFSVFDSYSGFDKLEISIDNQNPVITKDLGYKISGLLPGVHKISVKAYDKAGNYSHLEREFYIKEKISIEKRFETIYFVIASILFLIIIILIIEIWRFYKIKKHLREEILRIDTTISKAFKELRKHVIKHLHYLEEIKNTRELSEVEKKILEELTKDLEEAENIIKKQIEE